MNGKTLTAEQCSKLSLYILMTTKTREGEKVRRPDMERCELYKPGDFSTRYRTEVNE